MQTKRTQRHRSWSLRSLRYIFRLREEGWGDPPALNFCMNTKIYDLDMDWIVTTYDAEDNIIESWTICNRTESQAEKEAMSAAALHNVADWSMMPACNGGAR